MDSLELLGNPTYNQSGLPYYLLWAVNIWFMLWNYGQGLIPSYCFSLLVSGGCYDRLTLKCSLFTCFYIGNGVYSFIKLPPLWDTEVSLWITVIGASGTSAITKTHRRKRAENKQIIFTCITHGPRLLCHLQVMLSLTKVPFILPFCLFFLFFSIYSNAEEKQQVTPNPQVYFKGLAHKWDFFHNPGKHYSFSAYCI